MKINNLNFAFNANINYAAEKNALSRNCQVIKSNIRSQYAGMGVGNGSGMQNAIKAAITEYLTRVGTPAALDLLRDFQRNGF